MTPDNGTIRRFVYALLITVVAGAVAGRILSVRPTPIPTFGSNDRSRWAAIRALVDDGTFAIGHRDPARVTEKNPHGDAGIAFEEGWETVDKILIPETQQFYSSKPPLLPTMLAGEYWLLKQGLGWSITEAPGRVVRTVLFTVNWLPFVLYLAALTRLIERFGATDWGKLYVMTAGCFATFMIPFAISLNNHTIASWSALFAVYFAVRAWEGNSANLLLAGLFAGFAACNELPATSLLAGLLIVSLAYQPHGTLLLFLPAALLPVAALLYTNYLSLGQFTLAYGELGGPKYEYPGSHWLEVTDAKGIDWAWKTEPRAVYALHLLIGHHGLFSLTPVFLLSLVGMAVAIVATRRVQPSDPEACNTKIRGLLAALTLIVTSVVLVFYIFVTPDRTHNYGGWTCGPRQLMWLTPLFLITLLPCADWLARHRWGRSVGYVVLGLSVLSVSYPAWNPWRHPWIYDFMNWQGWISY